MAESVFKPRPSNLKAERPASYPLYHVRPQFDIKRESLTWIDSLKVEKETSPKFINDLDIEKENLPRRNDKYFERKISFVLHISLLSDSIWSKMTIQYSVMKSTMHYLGNCAIKQRN